MISRVSRTKREMEQSQQREVEAEEVAVEMGLPIEKVRHALRISRAPVSLETPIGEDDSRLGDMLEDSGAESPADSVERQLEEAQTDRLLDEHLNEREARILRLRFGIGVRNDHTLEEVGQVFKLTRERIRQIEGLALRKLRANLRDSVIQAEYEGAGL